MNTIREKLNLDQLTRELVEKYNPEKIIAFGSQVRGDADDVSDLDLIIIKITDKSFVGRSVDPLLLKILPPRTDCFVYTPDEFQRMQDNENPFIMSALEHATILYEKS